MIENRVDRLFVRSYAPDDAPALSRIYREAVLVSASQHYAPDQIAAWLSIAPDAETIREIYAERRSAFVACYAHGESVAFSDHDENSHIQFLYCAPAARGKGAAGLLLDRSKAAAWEPAFTDYPLSEAALGFFLKRGFRHVRRQDLEIGGVRIHNHRVERELRR
jgi:putative acetyltransferase